MEVPGSRHEVICEIRLFQKVPEPSGKGLCAPAVGYNLRPAHLVVLSNVCSLFFFCKSALSRLVSPRADPAAWGQARGDMLAPLVQPQRAAGWGCLCLTTARPGSRPTLLCANVHAFRARALCTPG